MDSLPASPHGFICTSEQYARSLHDKSMTCLSKGDRIGLYIDTAFGLISLLAVVGMLIYVTVHAIRQRKSSVPYAQRSIINHPTDLFMLMLFNADAFQALGAVFDIRWAHVGYVEAGPYCTAQGIVQQVGETSVAMFTLAIAVYTFIGVWWGRKLQALLPALIVAGAIVLFVTLAVLVPNLTHRAPHALYESPSPFWCWIGDGYLAYRIWGEYMWLWATLVVSLLTYGPLFLMARGNLSFRDSAIGASRWRLVLHAAPATHDSAGRVRARARALIAYPAVYSVLVTPLSVVRFATFGGVPVSAAVTFAVVALYGCSGTANVLLFVATRPNSGLFRSRAVQWWPRPQPLAKNAAWGETGLGHHTLPSDASWGAESDVSTFQVVQVE